MKSIKIIVATSCLLTSSISMPTPTLASQLYKSAKRIIVTLAVGSYVNKVIHESKDFTKIPNISVQDFKIYAAEVQETFANTKASLQNASLEFNRAAQSFSKTKDGLFSKSVKAQDTQESEEIDSIENANEPKPIAGGADSDRRD